MPAIVAFFVRQFLIIGVQLGIFALIEKYVVPLLNKAIEEIIKAFGVSEEAAQDILANEIITTAESLGLTVALSRAKLPLKIAERLGFTTKGFNKRILTGTAAKAAVIAKVGGVIDLSTLSVPTAGEATTIISKVGTVFKGANAVFNFMMKPLGLIFLGFIAFNNLIDFGNWNSGAYQKTFQKIFAFLTLGLLVPDKDYRETKVTSPEVFDKVYNTYKLNNAIAITNPFKRATYVFTRDNLMDLVDQIGATLLITKKSASTKDVINGTLLYIVFGEEKVGAGAAAAAAPTVSIPQIKVFSGVISQGTLGETAEFTPRPNDLIETLDELQQSATINLSEFIKSLLGKIVYEIKVVSTVTTKDGFKQRGQAQKILIGYFKDGNPKYKTILNKFATIDIFVFTERNVRTKIATIVLGPVDSAKLIVKPEQITIVEQNLKNSLVTSDISEIQSIQTSEPVTITPPTAAEAPTAPLTDIDKLAAYIKANPTLYWGDTPDLRQAAGVPLATPYPTAAAAKPSVELPTSNNPNKCQATTIAEFFDINRLIYPSVAERAKLYEALGLGSAAYYTGTAEQNLRLLPAIKKASGC